MRLFTGLALPAEAAAAVTAIADGLRPSIDVQWTPPEKLHITTAFIGEWPEERLSEIVAALTGVRAPGFEARLRGIGWIPNPRFPRVLYAGVESSPELLSLALETGRRLAAAGVELEKRPYRPHVTLARVRGNLKGRVALSPDPIAAFAVRSFFLYLSADGKYTKLQEFSLVSP